MTPSSTASAPDTRLELMKLHELPAMSEVAQQFMAAIQRNDCQIGELAAIIEQDPALLARIVGVANSAYYSPSPPVTTAYDAIFKVLGLDTSKSLVLAIILSGPFELGRCPRFPVHDFWLESVFAATLAQTMAPLMRLESAPPPGAPYLSALLAQIGLLAMVHVYPQPMGAIFTSLEGESHARAEALVCQEAAALGVNHCEVGAWLARRWHLPPMTVAVLEHHLDPSWRGAHWPLSLLVGFCLRWAIAAVQQGEDEDYPCLSELEPLGVDIAQAGKKLGTVALKLDELRQLAEGFAGR